MYYFIKLFKLYFKKKNINYLCLYINIGNFVVHLLNEYTHIILIILINHIKYRF